MTLTKHSVSQRLHCGAKTLHHIISAITVPKRFTVKSLLAYIYSNKLGTKEIY